MSDFVHLHVHSEYSLLDGLPHPKDLAARAAELQQPALALTDHGSMFAAIDFYDSCRAKNIKPIIGVEAYLAKRRMKDKDSKEDRQSNHLLLLAENDTGYQNLLRLVSAAELEGFYYYPRVDHDLLAKYSDGLIVTTGCPSGEVPRLLHDGRIEDARKAFNWYRDVFKDRFYVELQEHGIAEFAGLDKQLIALAREFNVPLVATNDAHYLRPEDANAQDILLCIQTNTVITDSKRMRMDGSDYYLKSSEEMMQVWREVPEALKNTVAVAERCNVDLSFKGYKLPKFPVPDGFTAETYLRHLCELGFKKHFPDGSDAACQRLDYELGIIHSMGFDTYFLIVWDLIRFAKEQNIWYNVRGSAAGSMAAYCAGITNLDPIKHRLIFERFLNPGRISMPDIDLDFQDNRRAELITYTIQKYGKDNVAQIVTFGTLGAKAAIRDVGRALDYPLAEVDRVAKLVPTGPNIKLADSLENVAELKQVYEENDYLRKLIDNARLLEGVARHASTHAAGVVVTDKPVVEYVPLHRPTKGEDSGGFPVTQFEMGILERVGLLKMDYLGLATLTIMRRACELIEQRHGISYNLSNIPVEDTKAFELMSRGDVTGVFQVEGGGMRKMLMQMRPSKFAHIVAAVSLYRPGPMDYIPTYINRLHGVEKVEYKHPKLEQVLDETYGIIVYQEQIIQSAVLLAGYKPGEADEIRKAVGKKIKEKIEAHRGKFVKGAVANGVEQAVAEAVYGDIEFFARYGFNKAHAANYAVLTCQTAFLKAYYPIEYMTALLTTETGNIEKVGQLVNEVRRMSIEVLPPDVNASGSDFTIAPNGKAIYFALSAIKNVGVGPVQVLLNARQNGGPFKSLDDFCRRVDLRQVNRRVLESLIKAGAMDRFGRRSQLLKVLDRMMAASQAAHQASDRGQLSMFGTMSAAPGMLADTFGTLPDEPEIPNRDKLSDEKELTGAYFSDNALMRLSRSSRKNVSHLVNQLDESLVKQSISLAGVVTSSRIITTKKGDPMAFVQIEDPSGTAEITVFPKTYARSRELWHVEALLLIKGKVELRDGKLQILCDSAEEYEIEDVPMGSVPTNGGGDEASVQISIPSEDEAVIANLAHAIEESRADYDDLPPPPEEPPDDFGEQLPVNSEPSTVTSNQSPVASQPSVVAGQAVAKSNGSGDKPVEKVKSGGGFAAVYAAAPASPPRNSAPRHLRIFISRTENHEEDVHRMRELIVLLSSVEGRDRFTFYVPNPQGMVQLDFPNHSTNYSQVEESLTELIGEWGTLEVQ
ncbi:MAG: DNA polymerase III subunit alpha [Chloroflexi bacterium]|nr:DNA polymerase III subunit alpha [Chloroflexota bacterium]